MDFGLSKLVKLGERTGTICGTLQYMGKVEIQKILNKTLKWYITNENKKKHQWGKNVFPNMHHQQATLFPVFVI